MSDINGLAFPGPRRLARLRHDDQRHPLNALITQAQFSPTRCPIEAAAYPSATLRQLAFDQPAEPIANSRPLRRWGGGGFGRSRSSSPLPPKFSGSFGHDFRGVA